MVFVNDDVEAVGKRPFGEWEGRGIHTAIL
jgi:hypothetical protein